ncbi:MAG: hypothetical protein CMJ84_01265 [Planctomycetes bacterium]|jgi:hypothetical protein|nr:hypothetical protein [Planctomycetota bacterium]MDP6408863.1 hypothetical protein [Planctomycetota bacterium]
MKWWVGTLLALVVATAAFAAAHWARIPASHTASMRRDCSTCHAGSAPRTHTRDFVEREHGPAALAGRRECLGCHEEVERACDLCHLSVAPEWHTPDFLQPALGALELGEHIRIARGHRESCGECHATTYLSRCAHCHRADEEWLGRGRGRNGALASPTQSGEGPR